MKLTKPATSLADCLRCFKDVGIQTQWFPIWPTLYVNLAMEMLQKESGA